MAIIIDDHDRVREIILDWPDKRNALGPAEGRELREALCEANEAVDVGVIVLSARGSSFCAGGDLPAILALARSGPQAVKDAVYGEFQGIFRMMNACRVPILAAVDGPAIGLGCDLALAASATLIGTQGWLSQGWIHAGLIPATGGTLYAARRGDRQTVIRMLTARKVDGRTAEQWNLAIATDNARQEALAMAQSLAALPPSPLEAIMSLSHIDEFESHLAKALEYQIDFLTNPAFEVSVENLLSK